MREIEFRGYNKETQREESVGQYTGFTDIKRPIEKYGWNKWGEELYIKDKCMIIYETSKIIINTSPQLFLSFEELQAIYETAKQIKEEK